MEFDNENEQAATGAADTQGADNQTQQNPDSGTIRKSVQENDLYSEVKAQGDAGYPRGRVVHMDANQAQEAAAATDADYAARLAAAQVNPANVEKQADDDDDDEAGGNGWVRFLRLEKRFNALEAKLKEHGIRVLDSIDVEAPTER